MTEIRILNLGRSNGRMCLWLEQMGYWRGQDWYWTIDHKTDEYVFNFADKKLATLFALRWS
jgi:hypothetical protein